MPLQKICRSIIGLITTVIPLLIAHPVIATETIVVVASTANQRGQQQRYQNNSQNLLISMGISHSVYLSPVRSGKLSRFPVSSYMVTYIL